MCASVRELPGRAELFAATGDHPYARLTAPGSGEVRGFAGGGATAWLGKGSRGLALYALGVPADAVRLAGTLVAEGAVPGLRRVHLPRVGDALLADILPVVRVDHWDFRWTTTAPPAQAGEQRVVPLRPDEAAAVGSLLDRAHPGSFTRPGNPWVRQWFGVRDGNGELVACAADRSRSGAGELAGIAVHPDRQGRGIGAALTAALVRALFDEFGVVALGVMADNWTAARLYQRLGIVNLAARTSADLHDREGFGAS